MSEKIYGQFDLETIEKLADIINAKELSELTITDGDKTITLKGKRNIPAPAPMPMMPPMGAPAGMPAPMGGEAPAPAAAAVSGTKVTAPIVGTFYAAPSPDSKPFVKVGDRIKKGDVIFIIESMKVMSEVPSEFDGVVKEICVNNGDAVEFGQTVMVLE
ncbi:acetyl-CoA carboxylase biotin carboxyl carrier protein [Ruminococcus albus]|uniref:Biotin carboxyl carrier protein of acetyl-CoA carboxylase n=1 Tax=Ruminococcus albus TaxID=1264 RepID=A0A1H7I7V6_RUMAL|nr:acetyl-CoA carboxylase biotin carboxyl carrier protein [Ruminococcus albus]SEK58641.1 acetyl-CoA carboxylase biotin carboxyl carrier protein [Ruminococcus albus]